MRHSFFNHCPLINATGCGVFDSNTEDEIVLEAKNDVQTFTFDQLLWKDKEFKLKTVDSCFYQVMNPTLWYTKGTVFLKFT
jgi:hypothetical protein